MPDTDRDQMKLQHFQINKDLMKKELLSFVTITLGQTEGLGSLTSASDHFIEDVSKNPPEDVKPFLGSLMRRCYPSDTVMSRSMWFLITLLMNISFQVHDEYKALIVKAFQYDTFFGPPTAEVRPEDSAGLAEFVDYSDILLHPVTINVVAYQRNYVLQLHSLFRTIIWVFTDGNPLVSFHR